MNIEMNEKFWWYLSRASGIVAWIILAAAVIWGLLLSTKILQTKRKPAWLLDLHRGLGALSVIFTALHLIGLVLDSYVEFGWREILIPFASEWQPEAVAWGVVGLYILIAVELTSLAMKRLPRALWKWVHLTSFVLFFTAAIHGAQAGTDATSVWYVAGSVVVILAVMVTSLYRIMTKRAVRRADRSNPLEAAA
jgi:methionine sulfoxide reductase heme-binding subunit